MADSTDTPAPAPRRDAFDDVDYADVVAINKFERRGALDALRDVSRQVLRNRGDFAARWEEMPVFGTSASHFDDDGVTALSHHLMRELVARGLMREALKPRSVALSMQ